jgi:hypothetical protein
MNELTSKLSYRLRVRVIGPPCIMDGGTAGASKGVIYSSAGVLSCARGLAAIELQGRLITREATVMASLGHIDPGPSR